MRSYGNSRNSRKIIMVVLMTLTIPAVTTIPVVMTAIIQAVHPQGQVGSFGRFQVLSQITLDLESLQQQGQVQTIWVLI